MEVLPPELKGEEKAQNDQVQARTPVSGGRCHLGRNPDSHKGNWVAGPSRAPDRALRGDTAGLRQGLGSVCSAQRLRQISKVKPGKC